MRFTRRLVLAAGALAVLGTTAGAEAPKPYAVGDKVADTSLPDLNGKTVKLSDSKDKVVLLQLFSHW